jgi:hypothetical protein
MHDVVGRPLAHREGADPGNELSDVPDALLLLDRAERTRRDRDDAYAGIDLGDAGVGGRGAREDVGSYLPFGHRPGHPADVDRHPAGIAHTGLVERGRVIADNSYTPQHGTIVRRRPIN